MKRNLRRNKKGISTVIATIIIVAIAIVMAIAVAYWAMGIGGSFTRFEKLQITNAYASSDTLANVAVKNTGTATATLDPTSAVFVNGQLVSGSGITGTGTLLANGDYSVAPGQTATVAITIPTAAANPGVTVELTIQSTAGNQYPTVVTLP